MSFVRAIERCDMPRPSHPTPRVVTIAMRPSCRGGTCENVNLICPTVQVVSVRQSNTTGKMRMLCMQCRSAAGSLRDRAGRHHRLCGNQFWLHPPAGAVGRVPRPRSAEASSTAWLLIWPRLDGFGAGRLTLLTQIQGRHVVFSPLRAVYGRSSAARGMSLLSELRPLLSWSIGRDWGCGHRAAPLDAA